MVDTSTSSMLGTCSNSGGLQAASHPRDMGMVRKGFGNIPLNDLTMERKRVEEFEESLCKDY